MSNRRHSRGRQSQRQVDALVDTTPLLDPCPTCGKRRYRTRKAAKAVMRQLKSRAEAMGVYRCGDYWHFGHTPWQVRTSLVSRSEWGRE